MSNQKELENKVKNQSKTALEKEKIALEIFELNKIWYKQPKYLALLVPLIIGLLTMFVAFYNGYFSALKLRVEAEKVLLKIDEQKLSKERDSIKLVRIAEEVKLGFYQDSLNIIKTRYNLNMQEFITLNDSLSAINKSRNNLLSKLSSLKTENISHKEEMENIMPIVNQLNERYDRFLLAKRERDSLRNLTYIQDSIRIASDYVKVIFPVNSTVQKLCSKYGLDRAVFLRNNPSLIWTDSLTKNQIVYLPKYGYQNDRLK